MNIAIVGHFGGNKKFNDGQTIKTLTIYSALNKLDKISVDRVDTYYVRHNPFVFMWQMMKAILKDEKFIILLSSNGRKVLFPVFYVLSKYFYKKVFHYAIGGRLYREISNNRKWRKYVNSFNGNWMESRELVTKLRQIGVTNAIFMPNFKNLRVSDENQKQETFPPFRFCTFSRVMDEKGIGDAIQAIYNINKRYKKDIALLDIYGPIEENYLDQFRSLVDGCNAVSYGGIIPANESVNTLSSYFALLFPTHWRHEGIPGTIIDALTSGVPIIARKWQYCNEMITDGKTGFVYDFDKPDLLEKCIERAIKDPEKIIQMKANCRAEAQKYSEEYVMKKICKELGI